MMSATEVPDGPQRAAANSLPGGVADADGALVTDLLDDLSGCYARYRHNLAEPFDPVMTLRLTGEVLASVRRVLTATGQTPGQASGQFLPNLGKAGA